MDRYPQTRHVDLTCNRGGWCLGRSGGRGCQQELRRGSGNASSTSPSVVRRRRQASSHLLSQGRANAPPLASSNY